MQIMKKSRSALTFTLMASLCAINTAVARAPDVSAIDWHACLPDGPEHFECARYPVPLDYSPAPGSASADTTIDLALIRLSSADPALKRGTLMVNPGGPGGSGVRFVAEDARYVFDPEVLAHYDILGFDPRGVGSSTPLGCLQTWDETLPYLEQRYPIGLAQTLQRASNDIKLAHTCQNNGNVILNHMSTADVARDMEQLRQALGEDQLNFWGLSYGSMVGTTYANLFPENVGRFVLDSVLDPIAWSTGRGWESLFVPFSTRLGSDISSMSTLKQFFQLCDAAGPSRCAFAGNSEQRFVQLMNRIEKTPPLIMNDDGTSFYLTTQLATDTVLTYLYASRRWAELAQLMSALDQELSLAETSSQLKAFLRPRPIENSNQSMDQEVVAFLGVACADTDNPTATTMWHLAGELAGKHNGYFGRLWTWTSSACARWPGSKNDRYAGPYNHLTANPVLILNTLHDPATAYSGAQQLAKTLPNSRLLTVDGWGHGTPGLSHCADFAVNQYLLNGTLPAADTVCEQDFSPFPEPEMEAPQQQARSSQSVMPSAKEIQPITPDDAATRAARKREAISRAVRRPFSF